MAPVSIIQLSPETEDFRDQFFLNSQMADTIDAFPCEIYCGRNIVGWRIGVIVLGCLLCIFFLTSLLLLGRVISLKAYLKKQNHLAKKTNKKEEAKRTKHAKQETKSSSRSPANLMKPLPPLSDETQTDTDDSARTKTKGQNPIDIPANISASTSSFKAPLIRQFSRKPDKGKGVGRSGSALDNTAEADPSNRGLGDGNGPTPENRIERGWIAAYFTGPAGTKDRSEG